MGSWQSHSSGIHSQAALDRHISKKAKADSAVLRILVVGRSGAGVSTIINAVRVLHGKAVSREEKISARSIIFRALVMNAKKVIDACGTLKGIGPLEDLDAKRAAKILHNSDLAGEVIDLPESIAHAINVLWNDEKIQQAWDRRSQFQVWERWGEFAAKCADFPNWGGREWLPSLEEYFASRKLSDFGLVVDKFAYSGIRIQVSHFEGSEMMETFLKRMNHFSGVRVLVFVADVSQYDQQGETNGLQETLEMFERVSNCPAFKDAGTLLMLNKEDCFREKLCQQRIPLNTTGKFPNAPNSFEYEDAKEWLEQEFVSRLGPRLQYRLPQFYHTVGTDQKLMDAVINVCVKVICGKCMTESGISISWP